MAESLAIKYRPKTFDSVVEQDTIKIILEQQIKSGNIKNAYLFCGGAGTGKTTCARIFANEINHYQGVPIELDAASHNGVDDAREIIKQAQSKSLDSEYKIFIVDECHSLSSTAWQAFLKLLEEPPAKSIFIFCTTDPQKIPKTILSRVQRYDFRMISQDGIIDRLHYVLQEEGFSLDSTVEDEALEYLAKLSAGHMRDALTMLDKCIVYSSELTLENVAKAVGGVNYSEMFLLIDYLINKNVAGIIELLIDIYYSGADLKLFTRMFMEFILDLCVYKSTNTFEYVQIPSIYETEIKKLGDYDFSTLLGKLIKLNYEIKWDSNPRAMIQSTLLMEVL